VYLPLALVEECVPENQRADVALVIDTSSSMTEPTSAGRRKLDAAVEAAGAFLELLRLGAGDQAAIVWFNETAQVAQALSGDRAALAGALGRLPVHEYTRLDLGVREARLELASGRHRVGNAPVLIALTDGRVTQVAPTAAVVEAEVAKAAGVTVYTIGLGADADAATLRRMASGADRYAYAPDAEELAAIYRRIAITLPCPPERFWGGR
jgi:Mg-chelatase subunit ChlD